MIIMYMYIYIYIIIIITIVTKLIIDELAHRHPLGLELGGEPGGGRPRHGQSLLSLLLLVWIVVVVVVVAVVAVVVVVWAQRRPRYKYAWACKRQVNAVLGFLSAGGVEVKNFLTSMLVKSSHFGLVATSGVSRETSMILWRVLVQQQFQSHTYKIVTKRRLKKNTTECLARNTPVMTELCYDFTDRPARRFSTSEGLTPAESSRSGGGTLRSVGNLPEVLSQRVLAGIILAGR